MAEATAEDVGIVKSASTGNTDIEENIIKAGTTVDEASIKTTSMEAPTEDTEMTVEEAEANIEDVTVVEEFTVKADASL